MAGGRYCKSDSEIQSYYEGQGYTSVQKVTDFGMTFWQMVDGTGKVIKKKCCVASNEAE